MAAQWVLALLPPIAVPSVPSVATGLESPGAAQKTHKAVQHACPPVPLATSPSLTAEHFPVLPQYHGRATQQYYVTSAGRHARGPMLLASVGYTQPLWAVGDPESGND